MYCKKCDNCFKCESIIECLRILYIRLTFRIYFLICGPSSFTIGESAFISFAKINESEIIFENTQRETAIAQMGANALISSFRVFFCQLILLGFGIKMHVEVNVKCLGINVNVKILSNSLNSNLY